MAQFNLRQYFDYNIFTLRFLGLYADGQLFKTQFYWKYTIFINVFVMGSMNLAQFAYLVENRNNLELFALCFSTFAMSIMANFKALFHLQNESSLKKLMDMLDYDKFQPKNTKQKDEAKSFLKFYMMTYLGFTAMSLSVVVLWLVSPLFIKDTKALPVLAWYPYHWQEKFYYEFSYVHQIVSLFYIVLSIINVDMTIAGLMSFIVVECDILSDTFENLYDFSSLELSANAKETSHGAILDNMNSCLLKNVAHHLKILEFSKDTGNYLNFIMIVQLAASMSALCMHTFQLTFLSPSSTEFIQVISFQMAVFGELFIYTWFGNEVIHKSNQLPLALYKMRWLDCSIEFKRNLMFVIMRSQKPIELSAINFFVISMPTFAAALRISWSAFAVLRRVHDDK